jgi:hypothetical protein
MQSYNMSNSKTTKLKPINSKQIKSRPIKSRPIKSKSIKSKSIKPKMIFFKDYPEFTPNLSPEEMFRSGAFGGTYWRPIYSSITERNYKNQHKKFPSSWWKDIPAEHLVSSVYDVSINKYGVKVGSSLEYWEDHNWITKYDPYGWVMWYCNFYEGRRCPDDERQISRWLKLAGSKGRFRRNLIKQIKKKKSTYDDYTISPRIRQTLLHWGYELTNDDFLNE